jgi:hypothetical protein
MIAMRYVTVAGVLLRSTPITSVNRERAAGRRASSYAKPIPACVNASRLPAPQCSNLRRCGSVPIEWRARWRACKAILANGRDRRPLGTSRPHVSASEQATTKARALARVLLQTSAIRGSTSGARTRSGDPRCRRRFCAPVTGRELLRGQTPREADRSTPSRGSGGTRPRSTAGLSQNRCGRRTRLGRPERPAAP